MTLHRLVLTLALGGATLYGCGSDATPDRSPITIPQPDAGRMDAGTTTTPPSTDAARPADAALAVDSGALRGDGGTVADSGARDSGTVADSGTTRDSGPGAVDSGAPPSTDSGTAMSAGDPNSAACLKCEMTECNAKKWPDTDFTFNTCSDFGTETAKAGVGAGKLKSALCEDVLTCIRKTRCADPLLKLDAMGVGTNPDVSKCICGDMPFNDCIGAKSLSELHGPCRDQMADAAETNDIQTLFEGNQDPSLAVGAASRHIMCSQNLCADECYAPCANQPDGTACAGEDRGPASNSAQLTDKNGVNVPDVPKQGTCNMKSCVDYYSVRYNLGVVITK